MERRNEILHGDCADVLKDFPDDSISAVVTDPPYGLGEVKDLPGLLSAWMAGEDGREHQTSGFMNKSWDQLPSPRIWREVYRVLKPGGYLLAFAGTRAWDLMSLSLRLAGFECRDTLADNFGASGALQWTYGQGFPKSVALDKAIDQHLDRAQEREVVGHRSIAYADSDCWGTPNKSGMDNEHSLFGVGAVSPGGTRPITAPASAEAAQWQGWGTALRPSFEPILVFRKPISEANLAANVLKWGCGGINIAATRVGTDDDLNGGAYRGNGTHRDDGWGMQRDTKAEYAQPEGRWPANVLYSHSLFCTDAGCDVSCPVALLDMQGGITSTHAGTFTDKDYASSPFTGNKRQGKVVASTGLPSRFFPTFRYDADDVPFLFTSKASRRERDKGCELLEYTPAAEMVEREEASAGMQSPRAGAGRTSGAHNSHPTVKPLAIMRWLVRLVGVPGCIILDPFCGSGTTLLAAAREGFGYIGIDQDAQSVRIARHRVASEHGLWEALDKASGDEA